MGSGERRITGHQALAPLIGFEGIYLWSAVKGTRTSCRGDSFEMIFVHIWRVSEICLYSRRLSQSDLDILLLKCVKFDVLQKKTAS